MSSQALATILRESFQAAADDFAIFFVLFLLPFLVATSAFGEFSKGSKHGVLSCAAAVCLKRQVPLGFSVLGL